MYGIGETVTDGTSNSTIVIGTNLSGVGSSLFAAAGTILSTDSIVGHDVSSIKSDSEIDSSTVINVQTSEMIAIDGTIDSSEKIYGITSSLNQITGLIVSNTDVIGSGMRGVSSPSISTLSSTTELFGKTLTKTNVLNRSRILRVVKEDRVIKLSSESRIVKTISDNRMIVLPKDTKIVSRELELA